MAVNEKRLSVLATLTIYTALFMIAQIIWAYLYYKINGLFDLTGAAISYVLYSSVVLFPFLYFLLAEIVMYVIYVYSLWYVISRISILFGLKPSLQYYLSLVLWLSSVTAILSLNMYYVPHSIFTSMIRRDLLNDLLTDAQLIYILRISILIILFFAYFTFIQMIIDIFQKKNVIQHGIMLCIVCGLLFSYEVFPIPHHHKNIQTATANQPNIILIGFDALRPDYLSYFNQQRPLTTNFDAFLRSATVFENAYTPLARTLPSWGGILTGQYPIHSQIRENNVYVPTHALANTLPKQFQQAGYETIFATDDRRFNNIDKRFGFDQVIGPPGTIADFIIGTFSDFPLSNLVIPSRIGKYLFPYSYANHGVSHTYQVNNFLDKINDGIQKTNDMPLFLAVHFNLSAWPFVWFNDRQAYNISLSHAYSHAILADDNLLGKFLDLLKKNQLLDHAIVILLSDHGISLAMPQDREIREKYYLGDQQVMKVKRTKYANQQNHTFNLQETLAEFIKDSTEIKQQLSQPSSRLNFKNYGIDASFGYGGDVLTLKQHHSLLAIKAYGVDLAPPHEVTTKVLLLDLAPTLLDLFKLPALPKMDGISLKPVLLSTATQFIDRPIYIESGFSFNAIEQEEIILTKVLASSISYYMLSPRTGFIMLNPSYLNILVESKQRAILQKNWMLAYYPLSERYTFIRKQHPDHAEPFEVKKYLLPPYFVLLNLNSGEWVTDNHHGFFLRSPQKTLNRLLNQFYGDEMKAYVVNTHSHDVASPS